MASKTGLSRRSGIRVLAVMALVCLMGGCGKSSEDSADSGALRFSTPEALLDHLQQSARKGYLTSLEISEVLHAENAVQERFASYYRYMGMSELFESAAIETYGEPLFEAPLEWSMADFAITSVEDRRASGSFRIGVPLLDLHLVEIDGDWRLSGRTFEGFLGDNPPPSRPEWIQAGTIEIASTLADQIRNGDLPTHHDAMLEFKELFEGFQERHPELFDDEEDDG